jgi:hypothetical protein
MTVFISCNKNLIRILNEFKQTAGRQAGRQQMDWFRVASEFQYYFLRECLCAKYKCFCFFGSVFAPNIKIIIFGSACAVN